MGIKKQYLKSRPVCKVTFRIPKQVAHGADSVHVVGEFNNWSMENTPMKSLKSGESTTTIELDKDREYQFRYLIDRKRWENDINADKYIRSDFGDCDNSVVIV